MQVIGRKKCALTNLYFPLDSVCSTWATSRAKKLQFLLVLLEAKSSSHSLLYYNTPLYSIKKHVYCLVQKAVLASVDSLPHHENCCCSDFFFKRLFIVLQNSSIWILELETDIDSWNNSMPARFNKSFPKLPSLPPSYFAVLTSSLTDFHLSSSNSHFLHSPAPQSASSQCAIFTH